MSSLSSSASGPLPLLPIGTHHDSSQRSRETSPTPTSRIQETTSTTIRNNSLDDLRALSALQQQAKRAVQHHHHHPYHHPSQHLHPHIHTQRVMYHDQDDEATSSMRRARSAIDMTSLGPRHPYSSLSATRPSLSTSTLPTISSNHMTYQGNTAMHLAIVSEKLREMQWEVSRLNRKFRESEQENESWFVRYSRRVVIMSNIALGCWIFLLRFLRTVRKRERATGYLARLFIPPITSTSDESIPLSVILISGFLEGCQSSFFFITSAVLHLRFQAWKRNIGFIFSTLYSIYLAVRTGLRPRAALYLNIIINILYVIARYYYLHGLLVFNTMRIL